MSRVELDEDDTPDRDGPHASVGSRDAAAGTTAQAARHGGVPTGGSSPSPSASPSAAQPPSARLRRLRRVTLVAVSALLLALVGTQAVVDARERAREARLAAVPGVLAPVAPDASEAWSADPRTDPLFAAWAVPSTVGELLVGGATGDDGTFTLGALVPATGEPLWTRTLPLPGGRQLPTAPYQGWVACEPGDAAPSADGAGRAVCLVQNPAADFTVTGDDGDSLGVTVGYASLLVVDTATGDLVEQVDLPLGSVALPVTGGYLTGTPDVVPDPYWRSTDDVPAGGWTVTRTDWGASSPRWNFRIDPTPTALLTAPSAVADDAQVALTVDGTVRLLDVQDGSLLATFQDEDAQPMVTHLLPGGGALVSWFSGSGPRTDLRTPGGATTRLDGVTGLVPAPDDGSASGVQLVVEWDEDWSDGPLVALDARTGEERWRSTASAGWSAALLDGVVFTVSGTFLRAVDAADGSVRWTADVGRVDGQVFVDSRAVLVATGARVDAFDQHDGRLLWSAMAESRDDGVALRPLPWDATAVAEPDGRTSTVVSGWFTTVGRRLALVDSAGRLTVLG